MYIYPPKNYIAIYIDIELFSRPSIVVTHVTTLRSTCSPAGGGVLPGERGDRTPLLPVHHLIMEKIKHWTQTLLFTSSRGSTASGGVTSFANLYLFTAHTKLFCSPFGFGFLPFDFEP